MGMILAFLKSPLTIITLVLFLVFGSIGGYKYYSVTKSAAEYKAKAEQLVRDNATLKSNNEVLLNTLANNKIELERMKAINEEQIKITKQLQVSNEKVKVQTTVIRTKIASSPETANGPVAQVLRDTIDAIQANRAGGKSK